MGLADVVLVAAWPGRPVQPVGPVAPRWRDDEVAQQPRHLRDGDRDKSGQVWVGVLLALGGGGDREVDVGQQSDRRPVLPGPPADDVPGIQAGALLAELVIFFNPPPGRGVVICRDSGTGPGVQHR